jgi:hypothetical protein
VSNEVHKQTVEVEYHPLTRKKVKVTYFDDEGRPHRDDGPAILTFAPTGLELSRTYCQHGVITRDDGPAIEMIDLEDLYHELIWVKNGKRHREDAPAQITTDLVTGVEFAVKWWHNDKKHRENGAAVTTRDRDTGEVNARFHLINGKPPPSTQHHDL